MTRDSDNGQPTPDRGGSVTDKDEIIIARCDLDLGTRFRETIFNFAKHREPEAYRLIVERKGAVPPPENIN